MMIKNLSIELIKILLVILVAYLSKAYFVNEYSISRWTSFDRFDLVYLVIVFRTILPVLRTTVDNYYEIFSLEE